jgi:hypothetical protein
MPFFSLKRAKNVMAYRSYLCSVFNDNFKILTWVLILFIAITPNFIFMNSANAASVGGWTLGGGVAQGASVVYEGTKQVIIDGKDYIKKGTAIVTPTAAGVAKVLAKGVAGVALSVAVEQLLGAVDWVLDPANNRVIYYQGHYIYTMSYAGQIKEFNTLEQACAYAEQAGRSYGYTGITGHKIVNGSCRVIYGSDSAYDNVPIYREQAAEKEEKYLPLPTVAAQVISNAESGDTSAQVATTAAAADIVAEAEKDDVKARPITQQLEATSTTKPADEAAAAESNTATGSQTQNPTKPDTTDLKLTFPIFCNWAPTICEAAQTVISFPKTLTNWWETANEKADSFISMITDFFKSEPEKPSDTSVDVSENSSVVFDDSTRFNFGSTCPQSEQFSVSFFAHTQNLEFSYQPLCQFLSMIKPFVVGGSYLIGAYIVMGLSRGISD